LISARSFIHAAGAHGFSCFSGVPCSYLGSLIDHVASSPRLLYIPAANEGDAVAAASGAALAGVGSVAFMQNSGLGNAVNPLSSLNWTFRIPLLLVVSLRGDPQLVDEPQHRLMGKITGALLDLLEIPWEDLPESQPELDGAFARASAALECSGRPYAFIAHRDSFIPETAPAAALAAAPERRAARVRPQSRASAASPRPTRLEALRLICAHTPAERSAVIASTGYTGRELYALGDRENQFYMVGSMGCAASLGLGLSLALPDLPVTVIDGDGALLMRLGSLATNGACGPANLTHIVLDNEAHESTGGQPTVSRQVSFAQIAASCGYPWTAGGESLDALESFLTEACRPGAEPGPRLFHLKLAPGTSGKLPRPKLSPEELCERFRRHVGILERIQHPMGGHA